jgi:SAM-dependent methyltransferase
VAERLVELLDPAPGTTLLEIAAGPGDTGFLAAEQIGPGGHLISSDFGPEMVEVARRRATELGLTNASFRVLDGQALDLADASIDGVLCRFGYMLMPEPVAGLAETRRVLRSGGRLAFAVWGSADENPWAATIGRVLVGHGLLERPAPDAPGPFRLADPAHVGALVSDAGLELLVLENLEVTWRYSSFEEYWKVTSDVSQTLVTVLQRLGSRQQKAVRAEVEQGLAAYESGGELVIPGVSRIVLAARPEQ